MTAFEQTANVDDTVRLTVVAGEAEAEVICAMLREEGIRCAHRTTDIAAHAFLESGGWREILVLASALPRARELMEAIEPIVEDCVRCRRALGDDGGWYPEATGELNPYCGVCAERVFGPA